MRALLGCWGRVVKSSTASRLVEQIFILGADQAFRVVKHPILHDVVGHGLGVSVPVRPANLFVEVQYAFFLKASVIHGEEN